MSTETAETYQDLIDAQTESRRLDQVDARLLTANERRQLQKQRGKANARERRALATLEKLTGNRRAAAALWADATARAYR